MFNGIRKPPRAELFAMITRGCENHHHAFAMPSKKIAQVVRSMRYDDLVDLAFLAITDCTKSHFVTECKRYGLE